MFSRNSVLVAGMTVVLAVLFTSNLQAQSVKGQGTFPSGYIGASDQLWVDAHIDRHGVVTGHMVYTYFVFTDGGGGYRQVDLPVDQLVVTGNQALVAFGAWYFIIVDNGRPPKDPADRITVWRYPDSNFAVDGNFTVRP